MLLNIRALKAVATAASTEQTRYYLNGVHLHVANGFATMVATNGHILMGFQHVTDGDACACIIPLALIKSLKLDRKAGDMAEFSFDGKDISIRYAGNVYGSGAIDAVFPDWRRVVPRDTPTGVAAQFNPDYLAAFAIAARLMGGKAIAIAHNGQNPALVHWHDDALGVVMPLSAYTVPTAPPTWSI